MELFYKKLAMRAVKKEGATTNVTDMNFRRIVAGAAGLEPVTSAVTGQRSNQLSYAPATQQRMPKNDSAVNPFSTFSEKSSNAELFN